MNYNDFIWTERFRPRTIEDCILPPRIKSYFEAYAQTETAIPNMILSGPQGTGKTTIARALAREIGADVLEINGSLSGNIDTLRNDILKFVSTMSMTDSKKKIVILDEADYLNAQSTQVGLRNFMEQFHENATFILTCNYPNKIIKELHSRCAFIDFYLEPKERGEIAAAFFKKTRNILDSMAISYEPPAVAQLIKKYFPDFRRVLNELNAYAIKNSNKIDSGILIEANSSSMEKLFEYLKAKNFQAIRTWSMENSDVTADTNFYSNLYNFLVDNVAPNSVPNLVILIADYQYKSQFVADRELNAAACLANIMTEVIFK